MIETTRKPNDKIQRKVQKSFHEMAINNRIACKSEYKTDVIILKFNNKH